MQVSQTWHRRWQSYFATREVRIGEHRADVILPDGRILELQHSPISRDDISAREFEYKNMIWLLDLTESRFSLRKKLANAARTFRWYNPWTNFEWALAPIYVDIGAPSNIVFKLDKVYWGSERCACAGICSPKILAF